MIDRSFLVYEHWRPDKNVCFYVGKGKRKRSRSFEHRNSHYGRIVSKLQRNGQSPTIKIVAGNLLESESFAIEIERIAYWRASGIIIANYTNGGDGTSGFVFSEESKDKIRQKATGRKWSAEQRAKVVGKKRGRRSDETRQKQSAAAKIAQKQRFEKIKATKEGRIELAKRMTRMSQKAARDPEVRKIRSANAKALWADPSYRANVMIARKRAAATMTNDKDLT